MIQEKCFLMGKILKVGIFGGGKKLFYWCAIFGFAWFNIAAFMTVQKPNVLEKFVPQVINENALGQWDSNITETIWSIKFLFWMKLRFMEVTV